MMGYRQSQRSNSRPASQPVTFECRECTLGIPNSCTCEHRHIAVDVSLIMVHLSRREPVPYPRFPPSGDTATFLPVRPLVATQFLREGYPRRQCSAMR